MTDIYIPPTASAIEDSPQSILLGLQGQPGSGKTVAALTFPNPIILNFDKADIKGLLELPLLRDVKPLQIPFWSEEFILNILKVPRTRNGKLVDRREAFSKWLRDENAKFNHNQTIILDSWSSMQDSFDGITFHDSEKIYSKQGEENVFKPWDIKISYSSEIVELLKSMKCHVVVLFHEQQERDKKTGELLQKIQPLMQGKFVTELKRHFPYFIRQVCRQPLDANGQIIKSADPEYVWLVKSTAEFDCKFAGLPDRPQYLPAQFKSLIK